MKNAGSMQKNSVVLILCIIAGIFVSSCGLEEVIILTEPTVTDNNPLYSSDEPTNWWFGFKTAENDQPDEFIGTEVYYKIYSNYSDLTSQKNSITAVNSTTNQTAAATRMIETYKYKSLGLSVATARKSTLIPKSSGNRSIVFRLKSYLNNKDLTENDKYTLEACFGIKNSSLYTYESYIPYRNGNSKSFDFFDYDDDDKNGTRDVEPAEGDDDYYYNANFSEDNCYYVQLFAVGVGWITSTCTSTYSLVLDLGSVPIRKGE